MTRIKDALDAVAAAIIAQKDYLTDLDRQIADGDHGINMTRGFQAAMDAVEEMDDTTKPGPVLETIGKAFIHNVGGAAARFMARASSRLRPSAMRIRNSTSPPSRSSSAPRLPASRSAAMPRKATKPCSTR